MFMSYNDPCFSVFPSSSEAIIGFELPPNLSLKARPTSSLGLVDSLWASGITAFDLRFVKMASTQNVRIYLLCRVRPPATSGKYYLGAAKHVQQIFYSSGYELQLLVQENALAFARHPFHFQTIAEIRRKEEVPIFSRDYADAEFYVAYPWEWYCASAIPYFDALVQQQGNWLVSIYLEPTRLSTLEENLLNHATSSDIRDVLLEGGRQGGKIYETYTAFAKRLGHPYLLRISLAASSKQTLAQMSRIFLNQWQNAVPDPILQYANQPYEQQVAERNLSNLEWIPWGSIRDHEPRSARLRYLTDSRGASKVFHLPSSQVEKLKPSFDICIVCALAEEAQAFLHIVEVYRHISWSKEVNPRYGYDYRLATITNVKGEALRVHVSWLPRYGSQEMLLHLSHVIEEYHPHLAVMTGFCAGDKRFVALGDLIVAERTFAYDSGKIVKDEYGQEVHLHDTITYQLHENILRFVGLFNQWKPRLASLPRPVSKQYQRDLLLEKLLSEPTMSVKAIPLEELERYIPAWRVLIHELQQEPEPFLLPSLELRDKAMIERLYYGPTPFPFKDPSEARCHIRPLASGNAVRSDAPFKEIQIPVRGAVAVDMEGAAFGRIMERFSAVEWLIVKGVSDYADHEKDDSYRSYAAAASAMYSLSFIEEYVTQERFPVSP
jgi:nucleoside phosphorylase